MGHFQYIQTILGSLTPWLCMNFWVLPTSADQGPYQISWSWKSLFFPSIVFQWKINSTSEYPITLKDHTNIRRIRELNAFKPEASSLSFLEQADAFNCNHGSVGAKRILPVEIRVGHGNLLTSTRPLHSRGRHRPPLRRPHTLRFARPLPVPFALWYHSIASVRGEAWQRGWGEGGARRCRRRRGPPVRSPAAAAARGGRGGGERMDGAAW